ncbi:MAG: helix-turn-helix domain-containing protein [Candidatus Hermodarchaeota archaeon]
MSLERIFKALVSLSLSETDAKIYIHLATKGPAIARMITKNLSINSGQVYRSLKHLQKKDIIKSNNEYPTEFSALPFEKVLDMLIELKEEQAQDIKNRRKALLSSWKKNEKKIVF